MRDKIRTTKRSIMNSFDYVIELGYCRLQSLLSLTNPSFCTIGACGWNADIYQVTVRDKDNVLRDVAISTGYRPFGNISPSYDFVKEYEKKAQDTPYENRQDLIIEFVQEAIAEATM